MSLPASEAASRGVGTKQVPAKSTPDTSHSTLRRTARKEFLKLLIATTGKDGTGICDDPENLPSLEAAYARFLTMFPRFLETKGVDDMRADEYAHLHTRTCLDYSGFGLFSHLQRVCNPTSSTFRLAYVSANLPTHALYGIAEESTLEGYVRRRIMDYFRLSDKDYCMVFTASKGCAVKLLAESYRFDIGERLVTAYDHSSQSIEWMIECARRKGAKVSSGRFRWPSLRLCSKDLKKKLIADRSKVKRKNSSSRGLFVFPYQSRVTGVRYSYQWIPLAQQNRWHVLLDASALGPRDMDALGLSVFSPDFIVSSFYKVFGADPSGFGCLFIKRTSISSLYNSPKARAVGMVRLLPSSCMVETETETDAGADTGLEGVGGGVKHEFDPSTVSSFSGPLSAEQVNVCDSNKVAALLERTGGEKSTEGVTTATGDSSHSAEGVEERKGGEDSVETMSPPPAVIPVVETTTITVLYPGNITEPVNVDPRVDVKGKRKLDEFETGESSTAGGGGDNVQVGPSTRIPTLRELLHMPEPESLASTSAGSETTRELLAAQVVCKALDQTRLVGMIKIRNRLRYLITWLVVSLSNLRHPASSSESSLKQPLVRIYGPSRKYDRGASVAFNLYHWDGTLLQPALVQRLADRNRISLGLAEIKNVEGAGSDVSSSVGGGRKSSCSVMSLSSSSEFLAVTVALSYVSNFEDVYRVWVFVAKFLDADFVNKEVWKYHSLNQEVVVLGFT